jgi:signal peptidase I
VTATLEQVEQQPSQLAPERYSRWLMAGGILGRIWLWFVVGCLAVTLIPMLFGWRPYVIQSGSMQPRIKVGDIVIASPNHDPNTLLGHVTVFQDPDRPNRIKTHRVIRIARDGRLITKGDANQSADSMPVSVDKVQGIGRLLVRFAGLPLVWAHTGKWLYLVLFGLSLYASAIIVARDREVYDEDDEDDETDEDDEDDKDDKDDTDGADVGQDSAGEDEFSGHHADAVPAALPRARQSRDEARLRGFDRRTLTWASHRLIWRSTALLGVGLMLVLPTAHAAFASITRNTADSWTVPNWNYTTEANNLGPYIYYKLDEASPSANVTDSSGNGHTGTYNGTSTNYLYQQPGAFSTDLPDTGVTQRNNNACIFSSGSRPTPGPAVYSEIVWFKTANGYANGGKLVGFETGQTGVSSSATGGQYDRHVYMDGSGKLWFGVWLTGPGTTKTINTAASYNDGNWHMMVATMGPAAPAGMRLYVDGVLQASDPNTTSETFLNPGYWRFGCGNLSGWGAAATWSGPNGPTTQANVALQGSLDEVAVYHTQLTATQIAFLYWIR